MAGPTFPEKVQSLRQVLAARSPSTNRGFPHRLDLDNAASSIASTAHVLEMLRSWKFEFGHTEVQSAVRYLAKEVPRHTQPKTAAVTARGEFSRYPAFSLWALTRYPQGPFAPELRGGLGFAVKWLATYRLADGGWSTGKSKTGELSLTTTMPAVHAFDRLAFHPEYGKVATVLAKQGRRAVVMANRGTKKAPWWTIHGDGGRPSGAATAMAILTLAGGSNSDRELARGGIAWLLSNPDHWIDRWEEDTQIEDRPWHMMSFSLGLRAVLHPCADEEPSPDLLRGAISYWDELWVEKQGAWAQYPGGVASTTGSFGVVVAARALKRAFPFDPAKAFDVTAGARRRSSKPSLPRPRVTVTLRAASKGVRIVNLQGTTIVDCEISGPIQWQVLELIARNHLAARESNDQADQTILLSEIASKLENSAEAAAKAIDRLNGSLTKAARQNRYFLPALIEDISPPRSKGRRYGLDEADVTIT